MQAENISSAVASRVCTREYVCTVCALYVYYVYTPCMFALCLQVTQISCLVLEGLCPPLLVLSFFNILSHTW